MQNCPMCNSKKVSACAARRLNCVFKTQDFTASTHGKLSGGFVRALFPLAESLIQHVEQLLGTHFLNPVLVTDHSPTEDVVLVCRTCGLWCKQTN